MKIKVAHMGLGLDLLGSQTTLRSNERTGGKLEIWWAQDPEGHYHALGMKVTSGKNGRQVGVPFANLKGCELDVPGVGKPSTTAFPKNTPFNANVAGVVTQTEVVVEPPKAKRAAKQN